jgi:hypothetical protein
MAAVVVAIAVVPSVGMAGLVAEARVAAVGWRPTVAAVVVANNPEGGAEFFENLWATVFVAVFVVVVGMRA